METLLSKNEIVDLMVKQLGTFFPLKYSNDSCELYNSSIAVFPRLEKNFANSKSKYFSKKLDDGSTVPFFNPFHAVQWMTFLYYLSHELYLRKSELCDKVYYLNKILHSVDLFYAIELPDVWSAEHPLGSVMGRAQYSNGLFFYHGCTVGGTGKDGKLNYPVLEENVLMCSNSSILGRCHIGRNAKIGAGALVKNQDVPADSIVFGQSPNLIIKKAH